MKHTWKIITLVTRLISIYIEIQSNNLPVLGVFLVLDHFCVLINVDTLIKEYIHFKYKMSE